MLRERLEACSALNADAEAFVWAVFLRSNPGEAQRLRAIAFGLATRAGLCAPDAEDVAQETMLALAGCEAAVPLEEGARSAYAKTTARNKLLAFWSKRKQRPASGLDAELLPCKEEESNAKAEQREERAVLEEALRALPQGLRAVLLLEFSGHSVPQLAEEFQTSRWTIRRWLRKAKKKVLYRACEALRHRRA